MLLSAYQNQKGGISLFPSLKKLKGFFAVVSVVCVCVSCVGGILLSQESFYFQSSNAYPAFFICWAAVILLPVLSIGITIVLSVWTGNCPLKAAPSAAESANWKPVWKS